MQGSVGMGGIVNNRAVVGPALFTCALLFSGSALVADESSDSVCASQASQFVEYAPTLTSALDIESGPELVDNEFRLLVLIGMFLEASCQLELPNPCREALAVEHNEWLYTLMLSGLLISCYQDDADAYSDDRVGLVQQFYEMAPDDLRHRLVAQAADDLGVHLSVRGTQ